MKLTKVGRTIVHFFLGFVLTLSIFLLMEWLETDFLSSLALLTIIFTLLELAISSEEVRYWPSSVITLWRGGRSYTVGRLLALFTFYKFDTRAPQESAALMVMAYFCTVLSILTISGIAHCLHKHRVIGFAECFKYLQGQSSGKAPRQVKVQFLLRKTACSCERTFGLLGWAWIDGGSIVFQPSEKKKIPPELDKWRIEFPFAIDDRQACVLRITIVRNEGGIPENSSPEPQDLPFANLRAKYAAQSRGVLFYSKNFQLQ